MKRLSFAHRVTLYFGALFLSALGGLGLLWYGGLPWLGVNGAGQQRLLEASRLLELSADQQRAAIRNTLDQRRGDILVVSENKVIAAELKHGDDNAQRDVGRIFDRLQRAYPDAYTGLRVVDPASLTIRASGVASEVGQPFTDPALIRRAALPGMTELIEQVRGPQGAPLAIVRQIYEPDADGYPSGTLAGILVAYLDTAQLIDSDAQAERDSERQPGVSLLFGPDGRVLARFPAAAAGEPNFQPDARVASGFEGTLIERDRDGRELLVVHRHLQLSGVQGWTLLQYQDKEQALAGLKGNTRTLALTGLLLSACALLLIGIAARRLTQPMQLLAGAARQFGDGDLAVRARSAPGESREIGELAEAFNGMADRIGKAHRMLEARVLERTAELASERDTAQRYLDIAGVMLMALDRDGRIALINRKGEQILGQPESALLGLDWFAHFPPPPQQASARLTFASWMDGTVALPDYIETRIVNGAGRLLLMAWNHTVLRDAAGRPCGTLSSGEDITRRRQSEETLRQLNVTLEQRVGQRTAELAAANDTLQGTLDKLRHTQGELIQREKLASLGALVAGVAHELNTPLGNSVTVSTSIAAELEALAADTEANALTRSRLRHFIAHAGHGLTLLERNLERASDMVMHFKQVAADQTSAKRRQFELAPTISDIVDTLQPQFKTTPHRIVVDIAPGIALDSFPGPLGQVVTNLALNALIHGFNQHPGLRGELRITAGAARDERVTLLITDNGGGIPAEHIARVFDPFFTTRLGQGGSGLGLHIVFNLVTATLGGTIHVDSTPGRGTAFRIELPCRAPQQAEVAPL